MVPTKGLPAKLPSETGPKTAHAGQHLLALQLQHLLRCRGGGRCRGCSRKDRLLGDQLGSKGSCCKRGS